MSKPVDEILLWRFDLRVRDFANDEIVAGTDPMELVVLLLSLAAELARHIGPATCATVRPFADALYHVVNNEAAGLARPGAAPVGRRP